MDFNSEEIPAIRFEGLTKTFGSIVANDNITFDVKKGEIVALLGENGSGKTSLMNMLDGIYHPESGSIYIYGKEATITSPKDAFELGIGMIHQHFKLVDVFSAVENIVMGSEEEGKLDLKKAADKVKEIAARYGFEVDPWQKVYEMNVSQKQTLEIIKVLYRGASIFILDEPTAVLTPQETEKLFDVLRNMRNDGKTIIIITHKLNEVLELSDSVSVLRKGKYVGTVRTSEATTLSLTEMMVGSKVELNIDRALPENQRVKVKVENVTCRNREGRNVLENVSFEIKSGEILGIAGIAGCGEKELLESIAGLQRIDTGSITYTNTKGEVFNLVGKSPAEIQDLGVRFSFVPEDRLGMGLVGSMGMSENMMLRSYRKGASVFTDTKAPRELAEEIKDRLGVVTPSLNTPVSRLSGGNVQKVLVGREIAAAPAVLMTAYAVRGLDINTSYVIYNLLNEQKAKGVAVVYVGEDLDVLLALCDRIMVLCGGRINGILDARTTTKEELGLRMTKIIEE